MKKLNRFNLISAIIGLSALAFSATSMAQCPTNKVLINNKGFLNGGSKLCPACVTKCVAQNQVQKYLNSGWALGACVNYCTVYPPKTTANKEKETGQYDVPIAGFQIDKSQTTARNNEQ